MKRYIRASELAKIMRGSHEDMRQRAYCAVTRHEESTTDRLPAPFSIVATFPSQAVIADAAGGLHRYSLREAKDGSLYVTFRERCPGRTLSESDLGEERKAALHRVYEATMSNREIADDDIIFLMR